MAGLSPFFGTVYQIMQLQKLVNMFGGDLMRRYGEKVHKLTLHGGFSCPNRDGTLGQGGCSFCNNEGFSPSYLREQPRMALVRPIIPAPLRKLVQPGVPEPDSWCVLVPHAAAADMHGCRMPYAAAAAACAPAEHATPAAARGPTRAPPAPVLQQIVLGVAEIAR